MALISSSNMSFQIKIDGQDVRDVTLDSLRKFVGVVPQDLVS